MNERLGVAIAILSSAIGGTAAAVTRYLVSSADPITLAILRWGFGFLCVLPVALAAARALARARRLARRRRSGPLLLRAVLRPLQHRSRLHDRGARQPRALDAAAPDDGRRRAARHRAADRPQVRGRRDRHGRRARRARRPGSPRRRPGRGGAS